ncbi:MAG: hypothetical protein SCALA702_34100 [Melioribacteraceae bacterium]|nr:MAG: hypothetical protein SCALA702_34100 [Melioribacteraceae bacterium]
MIRVLLLLFFIVSTIFGQFEQTAGPVGGSFRNIGYSSNSTFVASNRGALFEHVDGEWQNRAHLSNFYGFFTTEDALFYYDYANIYRSTDKGSNWESIMEGNQVSVIDYTNGNLYITVDDSLLVSSDHGSTWEHPVVSQYANTILFGEPTVQKLIDIRSLYKTGTTLILGCTTSVYPLPQGIYVTSDNGENWEFAQGIPDPSYTYKMLEYEGMVYVATSNGIFRTSDGGFNWEPYSDGLSTQFGTVYVGDLIVYNSHFYALTGFEEGLYKLSGDTWIPATDFPEYSCYYIKDDAILVAGDNKILEFNPDNQSTVDITDDIIAMSGYVYPKDDNNAYFVNTGTIFKTTDSGQSWFDIENSFTSGRMLVTDDAIYSTSGSGIYKSTDGGESWSTSHSGFGSYYYEHCNQLSEHNGDIYATFLKIRPRTHLSPVWEAGGIFKSTNGGSSWSNISANLPSQGGVSAPAYNMTVNDSQIFVRTIEGLFRSTNGGSSWVLFEDGLPEFSYLGTRYSFNNKVYAISNQGIFMSDASETAWTDVSEGLPEDFSSYLNSVFYEHNGILYLYNHTNLEVYHLSGEMWEESTFNFPENIQFSELKKGNSTFWVSTVDRGVWKGTIDGNTAVNSLSYNSGWNLISIPTDQNGATFSDLFSNLEGTAFSFDNGYISETTPSTGTGYWLNLTDDESIQLSGSVESYIANLNEGWNIIGPFHSSISVNALQESSSGLLESSFYGFNNGYQVSETLLPGKGYWIKASQAGTISAGSTSQPVTVEKLINPLVVDLAVTQENTYSTNFQFGFAENATVEIDRNIGESQLPPVPPAGVFDARTINPLGIAVNKELRNYNDSPVSYFNLRVSNSVNPFLINAEFDSDMTIFMIISGEEILLESGEFIEIQPNDFDGNITFKVVTGEITSLTEGTLPTEFKLYSNYPNPFNPATTVQFDIPESSNVELTVFDILGNRIATLAQGQMSAGVYNRTFNASRLSSGIYLLRFNAEGESGKNYNQISKMILMK